jgi:lipid II isoglutaminyl synthase (glutamine-hydrolysing)
MPEQFEIRIAHLYAHYLNIYGDRGNIITLVQRCSWRGIKSIVQAPGPGDNYPADFFDIYFIGGGQDKQQQVVAEDLQRQSACLKESVTEGAVILSICGGYQLLGHFYRPHTGDELKGISLIDAHTVAGNRRMIGNVVVQREDGSTLTGFENHSGKTFLGQQTRALGKVITGNGNNGDDGLEGAAQPVGNGFVYGTYLHGSLLPKNPALADEIISKALARRYGSIALAELDDNLEHKAHEYAASLKA